MLGIVLLLVPTLKVILLLQSKTLTDAATCVFIGMQGQVRNTWCFVRQSGTRGLGIPAAITRIVDRGVYDSI